MQPQKNTAAEDVNAHRDMLRAQFLRAIGWEGVTMQAMQADASFRRYYRLEGAPRPSLLMQDPPDRPQVAPYVMVEPFVAIARHLGALGLRAPQILHEDIANGLLVIEDFGDDTYTRLFNAGADAKALYELAIDVLVHLHRHPQRNALALPAYDDQVMIDEAMLLLNWYYPALTGQAASDDLKRSFADVWRVLFKNLPQDQQTLVLRDYHVDNLMLVKDGEGIARCGLLDFQDALIGQFSYDVMSLLEDARRDVPADLKRHLYDRYVAAMGAGFDKDGFDYSFRVLAAQRHAKVLGIFVRLHERDGKDRYLQFIPHVHTLFMQAVNDPALAPLKDWFAAQGIDIATPLHTIEKHKGQTP